MEVHLQSLSDTLEAIKVVHNKPSKPANPFTSAILNTHKLDVLDFIRDADQFETNLFWYPPIASAVAGPSSARDVEQIIVSEMNGAPRKPEPRVMLPPTPLRKSAKEAEARGLVDFDARTLLKAAHRLLDNYHNAPRARKHVRSLLKKHAEVQKTVRDLEQSITETDDLIEQIHGKGKQLGVLLQQSKSSPSTDAYTTSKHHNTEDLSARIQREEMEIIALEQMIEDAQAQKKRKEVRNVGSQKPEHESLEASAAEKTAITPKKGKHAPSPAKKDEIAAKTPRQPSSSASALKAKLAASARKSVANSAASAERSGKWRSTQYGDETVRLDAGRVDDNLADETIRLQPGSADVVEAVTIEPERRSEVSIPDANNAEVAGQRPSASDELEGVCENIWRIFGDHLRYAAPNRESSDYEETLQVLNNLQFGSSEVSTASEQDASLASNATAATSGSTVGSTSSLTNLGVPAPLTAMGSHILLELLQSVPPHAIEFDELKKEGDRWWANEGRRLYRTNTGANEADLTSISGSGASTLGSKAVYDLMAKKILRVRFQGKQRIVSFALRV